MKSRRTKAQKPKMLGGAAPRGGKWVRQPEEGRFAHQYRGSLIFLLVVGFLLLGGIAGFGYAMNRQLDLGLLHQRQEARQRPDWIPLAQLPPYVPAAFAVVVDTASPLRNVPLFERGDHLALTHDLVRQVHLLDGGLGDQARELTMAPILEARTGSRRLLELYLNRVYLGRADRWPLYGVYHASQEYFGKDPRKLTLSEAATLAAILLPPRLVDPAAHPAAVGPRRNEVLRMLLDEGAIGEADFRAAEQEPLAFQPGADYAPMTRPADWNQPPRVIRLPPELQPSADSLQRNPQAAP